MTGEFTDLAYIAGFFDGEGSIRMNVRPRGLCSLRISITNTNRECLEFIQSMFGIGSIVNRNGEVGRKSPCYDLQFCGINAKIILDAILPYLRVKHQLAELAILFQELMERHKEHRKEPLSKMDMQLHDILSTSINNINCRKVH